MTRDEVRVLIVDDDAALLAVLEEGLCVEERYQVTAETRVVEALKLIDSGNYDLVISDYSLGDPNYNGLDVLRRAVRAPGTPLVIVITAFASMEITLESIRLGAYDFLTKPFQLDELKLVVRNAANYRSLARENGELRARMAEMSETLEKSGSEFQDLFERLRQLSDELDERPEPAYYESGRISPGEMLEARRRRMRENIATYLRSSETARAEMEAQRARIRDLVQRERLLSSSPRQQNPETSR